MDQNEQVVAQTTDANDDAYTITAGGQTINLRDYVADESFYQVLKIALSQRDYEVETQHQAEIESLTNLKDGQIAELTQQYKSQIDALQANFDDATSKLAAAAAEIDSLNAKIKELELKQEKPKVPTNTDNEALKEAIAKAQAAKPKIYNVRPGDMRTSYYVANLLDTDAEITIPHLEIGRYNVVSDDEAARFREAREAAKDAVPETPVEDNLAVESSVPVPPSFQSDPETAEVGGDTPASQDVPDVGTGVASEGLVTREEFEALKDRVAKLEGSNVQNAA